MRKLLPQGALSRSASIVAATLFLLLALVSVIETSIVSVRADKVGLVEAKYGFKNLKDGHFVATDGENGYQADIVAPGTFRISPFFNILNDLRELPVVVVPQGFYGRVVANDGAPLPAGQIMADAWPDAEFNRFLDAKYFLEHGGTKGLQQSILKPGFYPLNLALFQVKVGYERNGRDVVAPQRRRLRRLRPPLGGHAARHLHHPRAHGLGRRGPLHRPGEGPRLHPEGRQGRGRRARR